MGKVIYLNFNGKARDAAADDLQSALRRLYVAVEVGNLQSKKAFEDYVRVRTLLEERLVIAKQ